MSGSGDLNPLAAGHARLSAGPESLELITDKVKSGQGLCLVKIYQCTVSDSNLPSAIMACEETFEAEAEFADKGKNCEVCHCVYRACISHYRCLV